MLTVFLKGPSGKVDIMEKIKVYFLGSGDIAVPVLRELVNNDRIELSGVGTQIDRPAGRKNKLLPTPVGAAAAELGIHADKLPSVNDPVFLERLRSLEVDMILLVSFGQLLKKDILAIPRWGCINIHASVLPYYRGASPIVSAILAGEKETGVAFMKMVPALDAGPVYQTFVRKLNGSEFSLPLEIELGELAAAHTADVLHGIASGKLQPVEQDESLASFCSKIKKSDGIIDWRDDAEKIDAKVRAYFPWPGARCTVKTESKELAVTVTECRMHPEIDAVPGTFLSTDKKSILVACGKGALEILSLYPAGGRVMKAADFRNGMRGESLQFPLPECCGGN